MRIKVRSLQFETRALDDLTLMAIAQEERLGADLARGNLVDAHGFQQGGPARHAKTARIIVRGRGRSDMASFQAGDPAWRGAITGAALS